MNSLDDLLELTKKHLGIDDHQANQFGRHVAKEFSGEYLYISKRFEKSYRDKEIIAAFNGRNIKELAERYGLSERQIHNIVNT